MKKCILTNLVFCLIPALLATGQTPATPTVKASETNLLEYPSLKPVEALTVTLHEAASGMTGAIEKAVKNPNWNCLSPEFYKVNVLDSSNHVSYSVPVVKVMAEGYKADTGSPFKDCSSYKPGDPFLGSPATVDLVLGRSVINGSSVQVSIYYFDDANKMALLAQSKPVKLSSSQTYTFTATPQAAPNEALTNGNKRDTGQLAITAADSSILQHGFLKGLHSDTWPLDVYLKNTDLFSTDENDAKSSFSVLLGEQRGLLPKWYAPFYFEQGVQGNQTASNLSALANFGVKGDIPWHATRKVFNTPSNPIIQLPSSPDLNLVGGYVYRINQLVTKSSPLLAKNEFTSNFSATMTSVTFPWSCTLLDWINHYTGTNKGKSCLGSEFDIGGWYLPDEKTIKKIEPTGDVSFLLPLSGLNFASKLFPYIVSGDPTKMQIRVKYSESVNATNNYIRSHQWTYGIELAGNGNPTNKK